jgi:hypothetical protein
MFERKVPPRKFKEFDLLVVNEEHI